MGRGLRRTYEYMGKKSGEYDEMKDNQVLRAIEILKKEL